MSHKWILLAVAFSIHIFISRNLGIAGPILLGETLNNPIGGTWPSGVGVFPPITNIIGMQFFIATQEPFNAVVHTNGTYLHVDEAKLAQAVGGNLFLSKGQTGIYDFYATNSPAFNNIAVALTDGSNGSFWWGGFGYGTGFDRIIIAGSSWFGGNESATWGLPFGTDFTNCTIRYFRLIASEVDWGPTTNGEFKINGNLKWQVYGFPPPIRPQLRIYPTVLDAVLISWPTQSVGFVLQAGPNMSSLITNTAAAPVIIGDNNVVLFPKTSASTFFRLLYSP